MTTKNESARPAPATTACVLPAAKHQHGQPPIVPVKMMPTRHLNGPSPAADPNHDRWYRARPSRTHRAMVVFASCRLPAPSHTYHSCRTINPTRGEQYMMSERRDVRVLILTASLRKESLNDRLATLAQDTVAKLGGIVDRARLSDF